MRRLLFLSILFSLVCFCSAAIAQQLKLITLDQDDASFGIPSKITLFAGDTLQFRSINGEFSIYIEDAYEFLKVKEDNLNIRLNSAGEDSSDLYVVRSVDSDSAMVATFSVYCISKDSWPDAPPKIIIVSQ